MEWVVYLKAVVLGLIEGVTEFLPISSTGHLIIVGDLIDFSNTGRVFEISIQLGAILAICSYYRQRLLYVAAELPRSRQAQGFVLNVAIAFVPAAVLGLFFHQTIKTVLFNPVTVAIALIVGGVAILWVERRHRQRADGGISIEQMTWRHAIRIGLVQSLALIPGTSRSGATILGGMLSGLSRTAAAEFSFFLALPTMVAATTYDLYKNWDLLTLEGLSVIAVGFLVAFLSAYLTISALLRYLVHHDFTGFAWYRIIFGLLVLGWFMN